MSAFIGVSGAIPSSLKYAHPDSLAAFVAAGGDAKIKPINQTKPMNKMHLAPLWTRESASYADDVLGEKYTTQARSSCQDGKESLKRAAKAIARDLAKKERADRLAIQTRLIEAARLQVQKKHIAADNTVGTDTPYNSPMPR
jgi:hypothetical protein